MELKRFDSSTKTAPAVIDSRAQRIASPKEICQNVVTKAKGTFRDIQTRLCSMDWTRQNCCGVGALESAVSQGCHLSQTGSSCVFRRQNSSSSKLVVANGSGPIICQGDSSALSLKGQAPTQPDLSEDLSCILDAVLFSNSWDLDSQLSVRGDCGVFAVSSFEKYEPVRRVIRLTRESNNDSASEFVDHWANRGCPYLPKMEESQIVCVGDVNDDFEEESEGDTDDFVLEVYEFVESDASETSPCDLLTLLNSDRSESTMKWRYMLDVVRGIKCLIDENWCHGDLSIENVVCGKTNAKIIDFESSLQFDPTIAYPSANFGPTKPVYRPPELDSENMLFFPAHVDVWSIGVMLFAVATRQFPFTEQTNERSAQFDFVRQNGFKHFVMTHFDASLLEEPLMDLLNGIFVVFQPKDVGDGFFACKPEIHRRRLNPDEILSHPFFEPFL